MPDPALTDPAASAQQAEAPETASEASAAPPMPFHPFSVHVRAGVELLAKLSAGTTPDQWHLAYDGSVSDLAKAWLTGMKADHQTHFDATRKALVSRNAGLTAEGFLLLHGRIEDLVRHLLHVLFDAGAAVPVRLVAAAPSAPAAA